jgi:hypothetical protein
VRPSFTPIQNDRQNYSSVYTLLICCFCRRCLFEFLSPF